MAQTNLLSPEALAEAAKTIMPVLRKPIALAIAAHTGINPLKVETGLAGMEGAIKFALGRMVESVNAQGEIVLRLDQLQKGIAALGSDFHILLGDIVWKAELQNESLKSILETLQAPLDTQAKELRKRAEFAYHVGWYDEAIDDLKQAQKLNYQDFALYRTLGNIYYYHRVDMEQALEQYRKAAKYASPRDKQQAAEAHLFASYACSDLQSIEEAIAECQKALEHNPSLPAAQYHLAVCQAKAGNDAVLGSLESAIRNEAGFYEQALIEPFLNKQPAIMDFLTQLQDEATILADTLNSKMNGLLADYIPDYKVKNAFDKCFLHLEQVSSYSGITALCAEASDLLSRVKKGEYVVATKLQNLNIDEHFFQDQSIQQTLINSPTSDWKQQMNSQYMPKLSNCDFLIAINGFRISLGSFKDDCHAHSMNMWDTRRGIYIKTLYQGTGSLSKIAASPRGKHVKFHLKDEAGERLCIIDLQTGTLKTYLFDVQAFYSSTFVDEESVVLYRRGRGNWYSDDAISHEIILVDTEHSALISRIDVSEFKEFLAIKMDTTYPDLRCVGQTLIFSAPSIYARKPYFLAFDISTYKPVSLPDFSGKNVFYHGKATIISQGIYAYVNSGPEVNNDKYVAPRKIYLNDEYICCFEAINKYRPDSEGIYHCDYDTISVHNFCDSNTLLVDLASNCDTHKHCFIVVDMKTRSVIQHIPYRFESASRHSSALVVRTYKDEIEDAIAIMRRTLTLAE